MDKIEMIPYTLNIIGATLTLIAGLFLMLMCIIKREKVWAWIFGILTLILTILLGLTLLVPLPSPGFLFALMTVMMLIAFLVRLSRKKL